MKRQWQTLSFNDYSNGMDTRSSPDNIPEGFAEDLVDVDVKPTGEIETRKGFEGFAGNIPLRINKVQLEKIDGINYHHFHLDTSFDFTNFKTRPLVVYGHLTSDPASGDFSSTDSAAYYDRCFTGYTLRRPISAGTTVTNFTASETRLESSEAWIGVTRAATSDITDLSWESIIPDSLEISSTSYNLKSSITSARFFFGSATMWIRAVAIIHHNIDSKASLLNHRIPRCRLMSKKFRISSSCNQDFNKESCD